MGENDGSTITHSETIGSIAAKLATVIGKIGPVKKSGYNTYDRYHYSTDADVFDAVRGPLSDAGIALVTGYEVVKWEVRKTAKGGDSRVATVRLDVLMADESGEWFRSSTTAEGEDRGDKAVPKAVTSAAKYWAKPTFLLATGEDVENDSRQPDAQRKPQQPAQRTQPQRQPQQQAKRPQADKRTEACEAAARVLVELRAYASPQEALAAVRIAAVGFAHRDGHDSAGVTLEHIAEAKAALAEEMNG